MNGRKSTVDRYLDREALGEIVTKKSDAFSAATRRRARNAPMKRGVAKPDGAAIETVRDHGVLEQSSGAELLRGDAIVGTRRRRRDEGQWQGSHRSVRTRPAIEVMAPTRVAKAMANFASSRRRGRVPRDVAPEHGAAPATENAQRPERRQRPHDFARSNGLPRCGVGSHDGAPRFAAPVARSRARSGRRLLGSPSRGNELRRRDDGRHGNRGRHHLLRRDLGQRRHHCALRARGSGRASDG